MTLLTINKRGTTPPDHSRALERFKLGLVYRSQVVSSAKLLLQESLDSPIFSDEQDQPLRAHLQKLILEADTQGVIPDAQSIDERRCELHISSLDEAELPAFMAEVTSWTEATFTLWKTLCDIGSWTWTNHANPKLINTRTEEVTLFKMLASSELLETFKKVNERVLLLEILLKKTTLRAISPILVLDPTTRCNFRCQHCHQSLNQDFLHINISSRSLEKVAPILPAVRHAKLFGTGEATLSPMLPEIIRLSKMNGCKTEVQTNGSTLGKPGLNLDFIDTLGISFDGSTKQTFEALRRGSNFNALLNKIRRYREKNPSLHIYFATTVSRPNVDELAGIIELAAELKVNAVYFNKLLPYEARLRKLALRKTDEPLFLKELDKATEVATRTGIYLANCISLTYEIDDGVELNKEGLLRELETSTVPGAYRPIAYDELMTSLNSTSFTAWPPSLSTDSQSRPTCDKLRDDAPPLSEDISNNTCLTSRIRELEEYEQLLINELRKTPPEEISIPYCTSPWVKSFLEANSRMRPCDLWGDGISSLATVDTFTQAWNAPDLVELRAATLGESQKPKPCQGCTFAEKHLYVDDLLTVLRKNGIDVSRIKLPSTFTSLVALRRELHLPLPRTNTTEECLAALTKMQEAQDSSLTPTATIVYLRECLDVATSQREAIQRYLFALYMQEGLLIEAAHEAKELMRSPSVSEQERFEIRERLGKRLLIEGQSQDISECLSALSPFSPAW